MQILKGVFIRISCTEGQSFASRIRCWGADNDYAGITYAECLEKAKTDGWYIYKKKGICRCPAHMGQATLKPAPEGQNKYGK